MNRVFVIGLDGATFDLITPWVEAGWLPNLGALIEVGVHGKLRSTFPPITATAWSSFQTGVNPGKHGVFDWYIKRSQDHGVEVVTSQSIARPTLWEIVSAQGSRVGVINVPLTYPVRPVNGFLIPGMLTPQHGENYAYPPEITAELRKVGNYPFTPRPWNRGDPVRPWLNGLLDAIAARTRAACHFSDRYPWDLFMVHFQESDAVQHFMWHTLDRSDGESPIREVYRRLDDAVGELVSTVDRDTTVLVISDHGFGPLNHLFHVGNWLHDRGYLRLKRRLTTAVKRTIFRLGITQERLFPLGIALYRLGRRLGIMGDLTLAAPLLTVKLPFGLSLENLLDLVFLSENDIDWHNTRAYTYGDFGQISLNLKGRELHGCVNSQDRDRLRDEIIAGLNELRNPLTGKRLGRALQSEELYHGDRMARAPDILFLPEDMSVPGLGTLRPFLSKRLVGPSFVQPGDHRMDGILIGTGPNLKRGEIKDAQLMDLAPTILYAMGLAIPEYMDGKVLEGLFTQDFLSDNDVRFLDEDALTEHAPRDQGASEKFQKEMKDRLEGLGYLG